MKRKKADLSILLNNTVQSWYWIGFILADGCLLNQKGSPRLRICLAEKDIDILEKFCKYTELEENRIKLFNKGEKKYVTLSVMDTDTLRKLMKKFDIKYNKTYNPPNMVFNSSNLLTALYIGFIDGDGNIRKSHKRNDISIQIKLHNSWLRFLTDLENNLYNFFNVEYMFKEKSTAKLNKAKYSLCCLSNNLLLKRIKVFIKNNNILVMERKWDVIDLNYETFYEVANKRKILIDNSIKKGMSISQIAKKLDISYSGVYMSIYRSKKEVSREA